MSRFRRRGEGVARGRRGGPPHIYIRTAVRRRRLRRAGFIVLACVLIGVIAWFAIAQAQGFA